MSSVVIKGDTSGQITLSAPAVAGTNTLTLPTITGTIGTLNSGTATASTSGTSIDFTSIPAGVRRITVMFSGVSTSSTSPLLIRIGGSNTVETTGYLGGGAGLTSSIFNTTAQTSGFGLLGNLSQAAGTLYHGSIVLTLLNASNNTWTSFGNLFDSNGTLMSMSAGSKAISATLTNVRVTTVNGTDTFDAGSINILYE